MNGSTERPARRAGARVRVAVTASVTALAVFGLIACGPGSSTDASSSANRIGVTVFPAGERKPLPDIGGTTLAGSRMTVRGTADGDILVLNVWASWCAECRTESPTMARLATEFRRSGVTFVGIDEQDNASAARAFARSTRMTYPQLVDTDGAVLTRLSLLPSYGIPSTLVVDRSGEMAARIVGAASAAQLRAVLDELIRKS